jgi:hypothetical protein
MARARLLMARIAFFAPKIVTIKIAVQKKEKRKKK